MLSFPVTLTPFDVFHGTRPTLNSHPRNLILVIYFSVHPGTMLRQVRALMIVQIQLLSQRKSALLLLIMVPPLVCAVLWSLAYVTDMLLAHLPWTKCGCKCLECRDLNPRPGAPDTFVPSPARPCRMAWLCVRTDPTICGVAHSTEYQTRYCPYNHPPIWPFVFQQDPGANTHALVLHQPAPKAHIYVTAHPTTRDSPYWSSLLTHLIPQPSNPAAVVASLDHLRRRPASYEEFLDLGIILATTPAAPDTLWLASPDRHPTSLLVEDGVARGAWASYLVGSCAPFPKPLLLTSVALACQEVSTVTFDTLEDLNADLFCLKDIAAASGLLPRDRCVPRLVSPLPTTELSPNVAPDVLFGVDFLDSSQNRLHINLYVDRQHPPRVSWTAIPPRPDRVAQIINLVTQSWVKTYLSGSTILVRAIGQRDMPKGRTKETLDWNQSLGVSFFVWTLLILLPVVTRSLVEAKVRGLRLMMKYHGLHDLAYYTATFTWWLGVSFVYTLLFWGGGWGADLALFVHNPVVMTLGFVWAAVSSGVALSCVFSSIATTVEGATTMTFLYVLLSGLLGEYLYKTLHELGAPGSAPWVEYVWHPATVYGGLSELNSLGTRAHLAGESKALVAWGRFPPWGGAYRVVGDLTLALVVQSLLYVLLGLLLDASLDKRTGSASSWWTKCLDTGMRFGDGWRRGWAACGRACVRGLSRSNHSRPVQEVPRPSSSSPSSRTSQSALLRHDPSPTATLPPPPCTPRPPLAVTAPDQSRSMRVSPPRRSKSPPIQPISPAKSTRPSTPTLTPSPLAIAIRAVSKSYPRREKCGAEVEEGEHENTCRSKKHEVVCGVNLDVARGERFGLVGPSGSGKTTLVGMLIGLQRPSAGRIWIDGLDLQRHHAHIHTRIGVCPQHDLLWPELSAREHLMFYGRLKNLRPRSLPGAVQASLNQVQLAAVANRPSRALSGGMRRRLSLAIALLGSPPVVFLDEPSSGLDPVAARDMWCVLRRLPDHMAILLTTHNMVEAESVSHRVALMKQGRLVKVATPHVWRRDLGDCIYVHAAPPPPMPALASLSPLPSPSPSPLTTPLPTPQKIQSLQAKGGNAIMLLDTSTNITLCDEVSVDGLSTTPSTLSMASTLASTNTHKTCSFSTPNLTPTASFTSLSVDTSKIPKTCTGKWSMAARAAATRALADRITACLRTLGSPEVTVASIHPRHVLMRVGLSLDGEPRLSRLVSTLQALFESEGIVEWGIRSAILEDAFVHATTHSHLHAADAPLEEGQDLEVIQS